MASSSFSSCSRRYDVFPSFSGEDVRKSFLSHLLKELNRKSINTFIDHGIERSRPIGPELLSAIRESRISVVIFSKNYASSSWCLNELVEIHKCYMELDQMVIPIFYDVDPSEVRKQTGEFGKVFEETCCKDKTEDQKKRWMQALEEVANMAGEDLRNWCNEADMIEKIADDVSNKLITPPSCYGDFVGIEAHLEAMNSILCLESEEARMVGIVGPSGIGKSTIARAVFSQLSRQFHYRAFVSYKRTNQDDYGMKLCWEEQFLSEILRQKDLKICHLGAVEQRLKHKRVLIFLDDVDDIELLKTLVGQTGWFGSGSRIIVITQDRQLLKAHEIDLIYEVKFPSEHLALKMLCRSAFGQNFPPHGFMELAVKVAKLAGNLPLGLNVLGSSLRRKDKKEWMEMLPRIQNGLDGKIEKILRVGYDRLDGKDQELFLFIAFACLFNGVQVSYIRFNYVNYVCMKDFLGDSVNPGIKMLADKSLIRITPHETIEMHNLLQKLAIEFFRAKSKSHTKNSRFLVDVEDIRDVFTDKTGTETILGLYFNTLELKETFSMDEKSFEGMRNLQFLIIRNYVGPWIQTGNGRLYLPQALVYLPRKLRLLKWEGYPFKCLPSNFKAEHLVELRMENSSLEKLWEGTLPLRSLKRMVMSWSTYLKELPDFSKGTNLDEVYLDGCTSLVTLPSSIQNLLKLRKLDLEGCTELESLPALLNLKSLAYLNLRGCSRLRMFPQIYMYTTSSNGIGIEVEDCFWNKNLPGSDYLGCLLSCLMRCMPRKFLPEYLFGLTVKGNMLEKLWQGVQSLGSLVRMDLSECENMTEIPDLSKATNLERLDLNNCKSLVTVRSTIGNLNKLVTLEMKDCTRLDSLPADVNLLSLETLDLRGCSSLKNFPQISLSIKNLNLDETAIEQVPCCIGNFSRLAELKMRGCRRLKNVSSNIFRLRSLEKVDFSECGEVTALSDAIVMARMPMDDQFPPIPLYTKKKRKEYFQFNNCFKLDGEARALISRLYFRPTVLPGGEVPTYFTHRASGKTLAVTLPQSCLSQEPFEFKACVVVRKGFHTYLRVRWHFRDVNIWDTIYEDKLDTCKADHLVLFPFKFRPTDRLCLSPSKFDYNNVEFEFSTADAISDTLSTFQRIIGCGIRVLNLSPTGRPSKSDYNDVESEFSFNQGIRGCGVLLLHGSEFRDGRSETGYNQQSGEKCDVVGTERSKRLKRVSLLALF